MIINHLGKLFVTSDTATIMKEMEIEHPAAKMLVMASAMQEVRRQGRHVACSSHAAVHRM